MIHSNRSLENNANVCKRKDKRMQKGIDLCKKKKNQLILGITNSAFCQKLMTQLAIHYLLFGIIPLCLRVRQISTFFPFSPFFNSVLYPFQDYFSSDETGQSVGVVGRNGSIPGKTRNWLQARLSVYPQQNYYCI